MQRITTNPQLRQQFLAEQKTSKRGVLILLCHVTLTQQELG